MTAPQETKMATYELIDKNGIATPHRSDNVRDLADVAASIWPNERQDDSGDYEEPNGWDIRQIA